jgi:S-adenosylmethionine hydrolase
MPLVSLTSDYGTKDHFVGSLKGQLCYTNKDIIIVDINHEIKPFDVLSAAYILKNASTTYPPGSIHIASINIRDGNSRFLIVKRKENYYVVPDNGLICLMFPEEDFEAFAFEELAKDFSYAELHKAFGLMILHIDGNTIDKITVPTTSYKVLNNIQAIVMPDLIRGSVFYVD